MVSMYRLDFSSMGIISVFCYFIACLLLISQLNPAYAHPVWITSPTSNSLESIEPPVGAVRFDKRSLASGRWGLRPGKRSMSSFGPAASNVYDFEPG
uniref:Uncharacterized protein n=1 Tax=Acrobeloides nanus TaxID=290746 RepID=A0A914CKV4_9BILA